MGWRQRGGAQESRATPFLHIGIENRNVSEMTCARISCSIFVTGLMSPSNGSNGMQKACLENHLNCQNTFERIFLLEVRGSQLPNNQRQHRTSHIQKDVLPYALY